MEKARGALQSIEKDFMDLIQNIPAMQYLPVWMRSDKAQRNVNVWEVLEKYAKRGDNKTKETSLPKVDVKHTDTSKGLAIMKERFANITPSLPYFEMLKELRADKRSEGILKLLDHLQCVATNHKDEVDGEHDVTEYTIKRLIRLCTTNDEGSRLGGSMALSLLLKQCPNIDPLCVISYGKRILANNQAVDEKRMHLHCCMMFMWICYVDMPKRRFRGWDICKGRQQNLKVFGKWHLAPFLSIASLHL